MYARFLMLLGISLILSALYSKVELDNLDGDISTVRSRLRIERPVVDPRIVRLEIDSHLCTGFVVAKDLIATASHCVLQKEPIKLALVDFIDGRYETFKVVAVGGLYAGNDWALLKSNTEEIEPIPFSIVPPVPGLMVASIGHPHGIKEEIMTFGMVTAVGRMIQLAEINYPGESGSPIIDQGGQVIGVLSAVNIQAPVAYVTPIEVLAKKLFQLGYVQ